MCDAWKDSFEVFVSDIGRRPSRAHSVERRDNDGPYSPTNCYWATMSQQGRNRRTNRRIEFRGEIRVLAEWADIVGLTQATLRMRLERWSVEDAMTIPLGGRPIAASGPA